MNITIYNYNYIDTSWTVLALLYEIMSLSILQQNLQLRDDMGLEPCYQEVFNSHNEETVHSNGWINAAIVDKRDTALDGALIC